MHSRTYLYREGDECTDITGGWLTYRGTVNNNDGKLTLSSNAQAYTKNAIPYGDYTKLCAKGKGNTDNQFFIAVSTSAHATPNYIYLSSTEGIVELDISSVTASTYHCDIGGNGYVTEVWLE